MPKRRWLPPEATGLAAAQPPQGPLPHEGREAADAAAMSPQALFWTGVPAPDDPRRSISPTYLKMRSRPKGPKSSPTPHITIHQVNVGKSLESNSTALVLAWNRQADAVFIQEPRTWNNQDTLQYHKHPGFQAFLPTLKYDP
jgi:hypothetical protein